MKWKLKTAEICRGGGGDCGKLRGNAVKKSNDPKTSGCCIVCGFSAKQHPSDLVPGPKHTFLSVFVQLGVM